MEKLYSNKFHFLRQNTLQLAAGMTCCDGATARRDGYVAISLDTPQLAAGSFTSFAQLHPVRDRWPYGVHL